MSCMISKTSHRVDPKNYRRCACTIVPPLFSLRPTKENADAYIAIVGPMLFPRTYKEMFIALVSLILKRYLNGSQCSRDTFSCERRKKPKSCCLVSAAPEIRNFWKRKFSDDVNISLHFNLMKETVIIVFLTSYMTHSTRPNVGLGLLIWYCDLSGSLTMHFF